jgi:tetratricopeptide (TPR) repeat protein
MIGVLCLFFLNPIFASDLDAIWANNQALKSFHKKNYRESQTLLMEALQDKESEPVARLNLALTFEALKEPEKAIKEYERVIGSELSDDEIRFYAFYNAGRIKQEQKKQEEALKFYQGALKLNPDSYEVKHNIELLLTQGKGESGESGGKEGAEPSDNNKGQGGQGDKENEKKKPSGLKPKELSEKDVQKILDELKNQEIQIRAKEFSEKPAKQVPNEKDW